MDNPESLNIKRFEELQKEDSSSAVVQNTRIKTSKILDFYRTAPFGIRSAVVSSLFILWIFQWLDEMDLYIKLLGIAPHTYCFSISIRDIIAQFKLKNWLDKRAKIEGYNERLLVGIWFAWCNIQTIRVIAKKYWFLDKYEALCERYKDRATF